MQTTASGSVLCTVGELGFGAIHISYEILSSAPELNNFMEKNR
jgi:hypothetical protein